MRTIEIDQAYKSSCGAVVIVEAVSEKWGTVRFTNGWVIATSLFWEHYSIFNPLSDCEIKKWVLAIHRMSVTDDGLWVGNISDEVALRLERLNLVELDRVPQWGENGEIESTDSFYILTDWGHTCAKLFSSEK